VDRSPGEQNGSYGEQKIAAGGADTILTVDLGVITVDVGTHELSIRPLAIAAQQLMRPLEIRLVRLQEQTSTAGKILPME
jgi:hypothetical protein